MIIVTNYHEPPSTGCLWQWMRFFLMAPGNTWGILDDRKFLGKSNVPTWRIIPVSKWLITMVSKSPK